MRYVREKTTKTSEQIWKGNTWQPKLMGLRIDKEGVGFGVFDTTNMVPNSNAGDTTEVEDPMHVVIADSGFRPQSPKQKQLGLGKDAWKLGLWNLLKRGLSLYWGKELQVERRATQLEMSNMQW